jgi:hypothetical protein
MDKVLKRITREINELTDEFQLKDHYGDDSNRTLIIEYNGDTYTIKYSKSYPFDIPFIKKNNRSVSFSSDLWSPAKTLQQLIKDINENPELYLISNKDSAGGYRRKSRRRFKKRISRKRKSHRKRRTHRRKH